MAVRYALDSRKAITEQFDEEVVVVNLESGAYYSLRGSAGWVWNSLCLGADPDQIAQGLAAATATSMERVTADVHLFVDQLASDGLLQRSADAPVALPDNASIPSRYESPSLEKFTDMEDLLLLDPVHDVDDSGWPHVKPEAPAEAALAP